MSNNIRKSILSGVSYVFGAQMLIMIIGIVRSLILPAFFSVSSFGYWEIYLFYSSYVGLFCLGYNDGIYLQYGGYYYDILPFEKLRSTNILYVLQLTIFSIVAITIINILISDPNVRFAMGFAAFNILVMGVYGLLIQILQITNQFKKYSFFSIIDKILVIIAVAMMLLVNQNNFRIIVLVDFLSKLCIVIIMVLKTKDLWFGQIADSFNSMVKDYWQNISIGIKLMIANLMSMLMVGSGRLIVQVFGNIEDFGVYSFGITVTNLIITAISAFSLVMYPILKRLSSENYSYYFEKINIFTRSFSILSILAYFPAYLLIIKFYTRYTDVLIYLNFLFGVVFLQAKISILNNTFFNALRKEKIMLKINMVCLGIFVIISLLLFNLYPKIKIIALCTFLTMLIRCYYSEIYLLSKFNKKISKRLICEIIYLFCFIIMTSFLNIYISLILTVTLCLCYFIFEYKNLINTAKIIIFK